MSRNEPAGHEQRSEIVRTKPKAIEEKPAAQDQSPKLRPDSIGPAFGEKPGATQKPVPADAKREQLDLKQQPDDVEPKPPNSEQESDNVQFNSKAMEEVPETEQANDIWTGSTPAELSKVDDAGIADAAALEAEILEQEREIEARRKEVEKRRSDLLQAKLRKKREQEQALLEEKQRREQALLEEKRRQEQARRAELLRQRLCEKQEEAQRLLKEAEQLQEEAETLDELQRLPREEEALRRTHEAQREELAALQRQIERATRHRETKAKQQVQVQQRQSLGSLSASTGPAASYYSPTPPSASHSAMRHKNKYTMKRRGRSGHSDAVDATIDVESQQQSSSNRDRFRAQRSAMRTSNPLVSVGLLLRKIATDVLTDRNDEELGHEDTDAHILVITLLIEAIVGIFLALAALAFSLFLYDRFVPTLPTVQNFKRVALELANNAQMLETFEVDRGLKLLDMDEYLSTVQEIREAKNKTKTAEFTIKSRSERVAEMKKEMETEGYAGKIPKLKSSLQLDYFCGNCVWSKSRKLSCTERVALLKETYNTPKFEAMLEAMETKSCRKSAKQVKEDRELRARMDLLLKDWGVTKRDFCEDCRWDDNTSCQTRMEYLHSTYRMQVDLAMADLMTKAPHCRISHHDGGDNEKLKRFCAGCEWGRDESNRWSCGDRVGFLMDTYKNTERMARLAAMERPACVMDFCGDCRWDDNTSCQTRMEYLHSTYRMEVDLATADLMTKVPHCRISHHDGGDNEKLKRFCAGCEWGRGWSCGDRVGFLKDTYKNTERMARLAAMERPACVGEEKE